MSTQQLRLASLLGKQDKTNLMNSEELAHVLVQRHQLVQCHLESLNERIIAAANQLGCSENYNGERSSLL